MIYTDNEGKLQAYYHKLIETSNKTISVDKELMLEHAKNWTTQDHKHTGETKKISVMMLLHKPASQQWLFESLYSVLWQITPWPMAIEIVVVLDPPHKPYIEWLGEFDKNRFEFDLKLIANEKKMGYGGSYNVALENCTGDYIFVQDYDDISHPHRFATQIDYLIEHPSLMGVSCCPVNFSQPDYSDAMVGTGRPAILESPLHTLLDATLFQYSGGRPFLRINPQTLCFRKQIAENVRIRKKYCVIDSQIPQMDRLFLLHWLELYPESLVQIPTGHLFFRVHPHQTCRAKHQELHNTGKTNMDPVAHNTVSSSIINSLITFNSQPGDIFDKIYDLQKQILLEAGING